MCEVFTNATDPANALIEHSPGGEPQWDRVDLPNAPASWGLGCGGAPAGRVAGAEPWPRRWPSHTWSTASTGSSLSQWLTKVWRFDRVDTVCHPDSRWVTASFVGVARHCGVPVVMRPQRRRIASAWWSRPTILPPNDGGGPCRMMSRSNSPTPRGWRARPEVRVPADRGIARELRLRRRAEP